MPCPLVTCSNTLMIYASCFHNCKFAGIGFPSLRNAKRHIYDSAKPNYVSTYVCEREVYTFQFVLTHAHLWRRHLWTSGVLLFGFPPQNLSKTVFTPNQELTVPAKPLANKSLESICLYSPTTYLVYSAYSYTTECDFVVVWCLVFRLRLVP